MNKKIGRFNQDKLSFPNTGGASVSPGTLSVAAPRQDTLRYGNSEAHIQSIKFLQYLIGMSNILYYYYCL